MTLNYTIYKPASLILDYLADVKKFVSVHPVINRMESLGENRYMVFETLKLGFIPCRFSYPVTINNYQAKNQIAMTAVVMKMINLEMLFTIEQCYGYSVIEEKIKFKSLFPIKFLLNAIFRKQHKRLFRNIESLF